MLQSPSVSWSLVQTNEEIPKYILMVPLCCPPNKATPLGSSPNFHELSTLCLLDLAGPPAGFGILTIAHPLEAASSKRGQRWAQKLAYFTAQADLEQGTAARYCRNLRHIAVLLTTTSCGVTRMGIESSYYTEQALKPMHFWNEMISLDLINMQIRGSVYVSVICICFRGRKILIQWKSSNPWVLECWLRKGKPRGPFN